MRKQLIKQIKDYYDYTVPFYKVFYHGESRAVHYGFWEEGTKMHQEALLNVNKFLAKKSGFFDGASILDAGCGVGGTGLWLAKHFKNINYTGITLSGKQLEKAKELARREGVEDKLKFYLMDYTDTSFDDSTFDFVWAIESVCHAENKKDFAKEAFRVLKKGGVLAVSDAFLLRDFKDEKEKKNFKIWLDGWALPNLASVEEFKKALFDAGFSKVEIYDKHNETLKSAEKIYKISLWGYPLAWLTEKLGLTPSLLTKNNLAGIKQYKLFKDELIGHRVFIARK